MRTCRLYIERYDWSVTAFFDVAAGDIGKVIDELWRIDCPEEIMRRTGNNLRRSNPDTGFTYSNRRRRSSVMAVGHASSAAEFLNSYVHELRHLVDDIAYTSHIPLRGEGVGYLTGELSWEFMDDIRVFLCCRCHGD